jgi:ubiquitin-small subunit ribosomal protein S27Ae
MAKDESAKPEAKPEKKKSAGPGGAGGTKRKKKNKPTSKKYKFYKIIGDEIKRERSCPRCGLGIFLMKASNRVYCGKCHYTEFIKQNK